MTDTELETGLYDFTDEQYFAAPGLSNSYLWKLISKTPAHAQVKTHSTDAMDLGSAVHLAVLQPNEGDALIVQGPKDRRGKKWTDAKNKADDAGQVLLTESDYNDCMTMRDHVWNNAAIASILTGNDVIYEKAAFFEHRGQQCKLKLDACVDGVLIDLKTSSDASARGFAQSVAKYGYHQQAASYGYGWNKATSGTGNHPFVFLVIEKYPPFACAIYELDVVSIREGWASYNAAIEKHIECTEQKFFPAYPAEKVLLQLPPYAFQHTNPRNIDLKGI